MKQFIKKHVLEIILIIFALIEALYIYHVTLEYEELRSFHDANVSKIDSLINALENKRDSIQYRIDTIKIEKEEALNDFKETFNTVSSYSVDSDIQFFTNYISEFNRRFSGIDNSESTQDR